MWASCWATRKRWCGPTRPPAPAPARGSSRAVALRQLGQRRGVGLARDQRRQHRPPRLAQDVGGHGGQLDVGALQGLLQPVDLGRPLPDQARPVAGQLPQLPLRPVRHEAAGEQPVPQQVGQPLAVPDVGLAPRHRLDVPGVDQQQREAAPPAGSRSASSRPRCSPSPRGSPRAPPASRPAPAGRGHRPEGPDLLAAASRPVRCVTTQATTSRLCTSSPQQRA